MQKKRLFVVAFAAAVTLLLAGWYILFVYFGIGPTFPFMQYHEVGVGEMEGTVLAENQLIALADTEETAGEIAEQYGIELISFENGIAVYHTEDDPMEVIARGQEKGYTQLSPNFIRTLDQCD